MILQLFKLLFTKTKFDYRFLTNPQEGIRELVKM